MFTSTIYIIRHGKSYSNYYRENNFKEKLIKTIDPLLYDKKNEVNGISQANDLSNIKWNEIIDKAYVSPLRRTIQTANIVLKKYPNIPLHIKRSLREHRWDENENHAKNIGHMHILNILKYNRKLYNLDKLDKPSNLWNPPYEKDLFEKSTNILWTNIIIPNLKSRINKKKGFVIFTHWGVVNFILNKLKEIREFTPKFKNNNCCVIKITFLFNHKYNIIDFNINIVNDNNRCIL